MKKVLTLLSLVLVLGLTGCVTADLVADGRDSTEVVGKLIVVVGEMSDDLEDGFLHVGFVMTGDWDIVETQLYVGDTLPASSAPGRFPYKHNGDDIEDPKQDVYAIAYEELDGDADNRVFIAAHAELRMDTGEVDEYGDPIYAHETAWAQMGDSLDLVIGKGQNWATGFWFEEP